MDEQIAAERFEGHRAHLRAVAHRMLGPTGEADDAVQQAWLRYRRADTADVANLRGWLTTVVGRICLDRLRGRAVRREVPLPVPASSSASGEGVAAGAAHGPEAEVLLAEQIGPALLAVLDEDVVRRAEHLDASVLRGAWGVAEETKVFAAHAASAEVALVDGRPGLLVAPGGRLLVVLRLTFTADRITEIDVVAADPDRLAAVDLALLPDG